MRKSCVILPHYAGLFSLINNVVTCKLIYDHVHVDWSRGCIYGRPEDGNIWNHLFRPTIPPDGHSHDVLTTYPYHWLTYKNPAELYVRTDNDWREKCHDAWESLGLKDEIKQRISDECQEWFLRAPAFISVLIRSIPQGGEQITERSQTFDDYAAAIEIELKNQPEGTRVFVAANDSESIAWMAQRFPILVTNRERGSARSIDWHLARAQTVQDAIDCIVDVALLSRASAFIHPVSNMATAALYINPNVRSIYIP